MRLQTGLLSLFLLALVFASYVDASAKKSKKNKDKKVPILSDNSIGRGDAVTLPFLSVLMSKLKRAFLVQSVPEESQVPRRNKQTKKFEELINKKQYNEIAKRGKKMSDEKLLKCLCQVVTSPDHFKGLYKYLKQRKMVPGFFAHGKMALVRKVIAETGLLETNGPGEWCNIYDAIALSLRGDHHERVAGLFEAAQKRPNWRGIFVFFVANFFVRHPPEKDSMPLKRFLSFYGEKFSKKHPVILKTICQELVLKLRRQLANPDSQKLLIDLVGQPSLLTPVAFAKGFLHCARDDTYRADFIKYGYKEAD